MPVSIREFRDADTPQIDACLVALQRCERRIEPNRAEPALVAAPYRRQLLAWCRECAGRRSVAAAGDEVVGFVCVLAANRDARRRYAALDYREAQLRLHKPLGPARRDG